MFQEAIADLKMLLARQMDMDALCVLHILVRTRKFAAFSHVFPCARWAQRRSSSLLDVLVFNATSSAE